MRLAITGTTGRVGRALAAGLGDRHEVIELPRRDWEFGADGLVERLADLDFDLLLNPAGMTSLEACESDPALAKVANVDAPTSMARLCRRLGRQMLHFSTDYVLDGSVPGLHAEDSVVSPQSVYTRTKAEGESGVLASGGCVMRVSWVFGPEKPAFPEQCVDFALEGKPLVAIGDKTSLPCFTTDLVGWISRLIEVGLPGEVLHACNRGTPVSWLGIAEFIHAYLLEHQRIEEAPAMVPKRLKEMTGFKAVRPRHTAMSTGRLSALMGWQPRGWEEALRDHLDWLLLSR